MWGKSSQPWKWHCILRYETKHDQQKKKTRLQS